MRNERGSVHLMGLILLLILSGVFTKFITVKHRALEEVQDRTQTYLCFQYLSKEGHSFVQEINLLNHLLIYGNVAQLISLFLPGAQVSAATMRNIKRIIKFRQNWRLISYLKNVTATSKCSFRQKMDFAKTPYKLAPGLKFFKRGKLGMVLLRKKQWDVIVKGQSFELNGRFFIRDQYSAPYAFQVKETAVKWPLRGPFGSLF